MAESKEQFEQARKAYPGTKLGLEQEYSNFIWRSKNTLRGLPKYNPGKTTVLLLPAIKNQITWRSKTLGKRFVPPWKNFQTWINNQCWQEEAPAWCNPLPDLFCSFDGKRINRNTCDRVGNDVFCSRECRKKKLGW